MDANLRFRLKTDLCGQGLSVGDGVGGGRKTQSQRFQVLRLKSLSKRSVFGRQFLMIRVDSRPDRRNRAAILNFSGVSASLVHVKCQDYYTVFLAFKLQADGSIEAPVPEVFDWLTKHVQVGAHYKKMTIPSKVAVRQSRSPVFFKFVRVDYDKDQGRLNLSKGEFAGHEVISKSGERDTGETKENSPEYDESIVGSEEAESDSAGKEISQLYIIYDNIYPVEHLEGALEMVDLCHFKLPVIKSF